MTTTHEQQSVMAFDDPDLLPPYTFLLPANAGITQCKSCNADIVWTKTPSGADVPLSMATRAQIGTRWTAVSHFRDCPHASGWGKR